jgi:hypothetical protein
MPRLKFFQKFFGKKGKTPYFGFKIFQKFSGIFIYYMKIQLTESQLKTVIQDIVTEQKTNEVNNQLNWLRSYVSSPKYLERLRKEFPGKSEQFIQNERNARLNNLKGMENKTHYVKSIGKKPGWFSGIMIPKERQGEVYNNQKEKWEPDMSVKSSKGIDKPGHVYFEKEYQPKNWNPYPGYETIPTHEYGHIVDDGGARIPLSTKQKIHNYTNSTYNTYNPSYKSNGMTFSYQSTPTEFINRLQSVRYLLNQTKIYNSSTNQFTEKEYNMMINNPTIKNNVHYEDIMKSLKGNANDKKKYFIDLMNTTASIKPTVNPNNSGTSVA